jgi:hypothetical protein
MKNFILFLLLLSVKANAGGFLFEDATERIAPPSPTRPRARAQAPAGPTTPGDRRTEAGVCTTGRCPGAKAPRTGLQRIDPARIAGAERPTPARRNPAGTGNACLRNLILQSAKNTVRRLYGNRSFSVGKCAQGVRFILNGSGMINSGGMGDAVTWHITGKLRREGFENIMSKGYNARNAPPGAILIFRGPLTNMSSPSGGLPPRYLRRGRGAGTWVGHVSVKGEVADRFYTDGRTEAAAGYNRELVGVYVPVRCVHCRGAAAKCEGAAE